MRSRSSGGHGDRGRRRPGMRVSGLGRATHWCFRRAAALLAVLFVAACSSPAPPEAGTPYGPAVTWSNPTLPAGLGLEHRVVPSQALRTGVGYVVWTPPGYHSAHNQNLRYPVIYFLHGIGGNESQDAPAFAQKVRDAVTAGALPEVIVVFPNGGRSGYRGAVETMLLEELIPEVDGKYRTLAQREGRVLVGFSMGGGGAMYLAAKYPDKFLAAAAWAGGTQRKNEDLYQVTAKNAAPIKHLGTGFLLVMGDLDQKEARAAYAEYLQELGIAHELVILPGVGHDLGKFYELTGERTLGFVGRMLRGG